MKIWHNDRLVDHLEMPPAGAAWLMGDGAFETIRTYSGVPFALERHLKRLNESLIHLVITPINGNLICEAVREVIAANPAEPYGRLRISIFSDGELVVTHVPFSEVIEDASLAKYPQVKNSTYSIAKTKSSSYAENFRALRMAKQRGFTDALFVNERNEVVESALANVIYLQNDEWLTPELESGCLPGVTRALLIENFGVRESVLREPDLAACQAVAVISSLREIVAVERYESNLYPSSKQLRELQASFGNWIRDSISL